MFREVIKVKIRELMSTFSCVIIMKLPNFTVEMRREFMTVTTRIIIGTLPQKIILKLLH